MAETRILRGGAGVMLASALAIVAGCTNPLGRSSMDYDQVVSPEKLRRIGMLSLDAQPAATTALDTDGTDEALRAARARFDGMERYELPLEEVRAATLSNNLDLQVVLVNPTIAEQRVSEEEGRFEAAFTTVAQWAETDDAVANSLDGSTSRNQFVQPGIRIPLRTGGTAEINLPISRFDTNRPFTTLNPTITTDLSLSLSHQLLRGAGRRATMHGVRIANYNLQSSEAQTKLEIIRQLAAADRSYWRLYAQREALGVRYSQYETALEQLESARRRHRAGAVVEIEVVRAESGVADRVEGIIIALNEVRLRQRELKRIMNIPGLDVATEVNIMPVSLPDPVEYRFDGEALSALALDNRMELLELEIQLASDAANIAFAKNQALPLLAMSYSYRINGLGGAAKDSFELLGQNRFEDWTVGINAEIPLGNEERRARLAQAVLGRIQSLSTRDARRQSIRTEVHNAIDQLRSTWYRILAAQRAVALNLRALSEERRRFDAGRSTSNDVLDADDRLAEAQFGEISAIVEYQIAQVDIAVATGTLLGASRVDWAPSDPGTDDLGPTRYRPIDGVFNGPGWSSAPDPASDPGPDDTDLAPEARVGG